MNKKPLSKLISELEQELLSLGYTNGSMTFYRRRLLSKNTCYTFKKEAEGNCRTFVSGRD